ncbi:HNH endonuclease [Pseudoxanthomonas kalamensis DSM 18571]|uniref:HNH endonuclease n=1 Tax=Pseudoxanthomonas kalamensis TaxID=289483 RepID=UPI0013912AAE|nr:HNH endonuclease [Pseudoxanthomonas kalamensis]KAF1711137.1 HNH endonuclease [Pseudoxanthomonas kalamensis DSM 18571]
MSQRIADCLEVLDLVRSLARQSPRSHSSEWRQKAIAHVASRGVRTKTVFAHLVGKNTNDTLSANEIDQLITEWIKDGSPLLRQWLARSCSESDAERVARFFLTEDTTPIATDIGEPEPTGRHLVTTYRVLRDTALARRIKADMDYTCQNCSARIVLGNGAPYAEAHHVKPLGAPHNGPDHPGNIVCVCPNCHVMLDYGAIVADPTKFSNVLPDFISYHNDVILRGKA